MKRKRKRLVRIICCIVMAISMSYGLAAAFRMEYYDVQYAESKRTGKELGQEDPYTNREIAITGTAVVTVSLIALQGYLIAQEEK